MLGRTIFMDVLVQSLFVLCVLKKTVEAKELIVQERNKCDPSKNMLTTLQPTEVFVTHQ